MKIHVLGIGQSLRGDDAAGLEAVREWQREHPQNAEKVQVELLELPGLALLDFLAGVDAAVLVDAVHAPHLAVGSLLHLKMDELAAFTKGAGSAHGWGVAETIMLGLALRPELANCRISLIGIVGGHFGLGAGLSKAVRAALPEAVKWIDQEVQGLL